jgi:hypothetical protein
MPEDRQRRRSGDPSPGDSLFRKLNKNPLIDKAIYALATVLIGGSASIATHEVADANSIARQEQNRAEVLKLQAELGDLRAKMYERVRKEEEAREAIERHLHDRLIVVETKIGMH